MKNYFRGWKTVFYFTLHQATKTAAFKAVTLLAALAIIIIFVVINVNVAKPKEDIVISPIKSVFIIDNSGLQPTDFRKYNPALSTEQFKNVQFIPSSSHNKDKLDGSSLFKKKDSVALLITLTNGDYLLEAFIPTGSTITTDQTQILLAQIKIAFEASKLWQFGLTSEQLSVIMTPNVTSYQSVGENTNMIAMVIRLIIPILFGLIMYIMFLFYGQTISRSVSTEKTSKLMETLLAIIHPYALITGKVIAITTIAVFQFVFWIMAGIVGLYGGNSVAHYFYPEYQNSVVTIINFLKDNIGKSAMSAPTVILAVSIFCIGILFYSIFAGLVGSMVSKPEDVAATQGIMMFPIIFSFFVCCFAPLTENKNIMNIVRYIPFTIPFGVPADLLTGILNPLKGTISLAVLAVFCILLITLAGRLYKGFVLYNGQKINLKLIVNILKTKV